MIEHSKGLELPKIVRGVEARPHEFPFMVSDTHDGQDGDVSDSHDGQDGDVSDVSDSHDGQDGDVSDGSCEDQQW